MNLPELILALQKFEAESQFTKRATTIGETILQLGEKLKKANSEAAQLKAENKKLRSALRSITKKYSDNSSYYEEHLMEHDEQFKKAMEALNKN